jgi:hypothetical protein
MRRHLGGLSLVIACLLGTAVSAQDSDLTAGKLLYQDNCGVCHGMIESDARYHYPAPSELEAPAPSPGHRKPASYAERLGSSRQGCASDEVKVLCRQLPDSDGKHIRGVER